MSSISSATVPKGFKITDTNDQSRSYTVEESIGEGRFAIVYKALSSSGEYVAIKLNIPDKRDSNLKAEKEARTLQFLVDVPHTPQFLCTFKTKVDSKELIAIVTRLIPCKDTFGAFLDPDSTSKFTCEKTFLLAGQILESLEVLHRDKQCAHRDVKTENLFLNEETSEAFLIDFGSIRELQNMPADEPIGTHRFKPPELVFTLSYKKRFDASVDLWALGASLFALYTKSSLIEITHDKSFWKSDYLEQLVQNFGMPNKEFIESLGAIESAFFNPIKVDGVVTGYSLRNPPNQYSPEFRWIEHFNKLKLYANKHYPGLPLWKARIFIAAKHKKETPEQAEKIIRLIESMLNYELRQSYLSIPNYEERVKITAVGCLKTLAAETSKPKVIIHTGESKDN